MSNGAPASSSPSFAIGDPLDLAWSKIRAATHGGPQAAAARRSALDLAELAEPSVTAACAQPMHLAGDPTWACSPLQSGVWRKSRVGGGVR